VTLRTGRWLMIVVPASLYFFSYFHRVAPSVVAADLMRAFEITAASLAMLAAIYSYVFVAMALVAGSLADTLGPRWTMALGGVAMGLGAALFGLAPGFGTALAGRLLVSLGASVMLIAWLALIAAWFRPDEFATYSGLTQSIGNLGALVASSPLALLVEAAGWRQTFVLIGGVTLLLAIVAVLVVRDRPEHVGLPPVVAGCQPPPAGLDEMLSGVPALVANPRTWPPVLAAAGMYATLITFQGLWGVPYLTQVYGLSRVQAANDLALLAVGFAAGSPLVGWLSDRWLRRRRLPMTVFASGYLLCWLLLVIPSERPLPEPWLAPFFFTMGLTGSALALVWTCVREVNDPSRVGIAVGFCNMPIFLGFALMQWLTGIVLDANWDGLAVAGARVYDADAYRAAFLVCAGTAAAALAASLFVTETRGRNVWSSAR
jgi:sugar phosphate permease